MAKHYKHVVLGGGNSAGYFAREWVARNGAKGELVRRAGIAVSCRDCCAVQGMLRRSGMLRRAGIASLVPMRCPTVQGQAAALGVSSWESSCWLVKLGCKIKRLPAACTLPCLPLLALLALLA